MKEEQLIFLISQPRSGSTLLQALLSNHPHIDTTSETWIQLPFLSIFRSDIIQASYDHKLALDALNDFLIKSNNVDSIRKDTKTLLLNLYQSISTARSNYILDKTPRYYEILDELLAWFPESRYILLRRNPVLVFKSIMDTWNRYSVQSIVKFHGRDLFHGPHLIHNFIKKNKNHPQLFNLSYEELVADPVSQLTSLCSWLGVEFTPSLIDYSNNTSFQGKYGDPIGVRKHFTVAFPESKEDQIRSIENHKRSDLLRGYGHHLGIGFLKDYGNYDYLDSYKKTNSFKYLKSLSDSPFTPLRTQIKNRILQLFYE